MTKQHRKKNGSQWLLSLFVTTAIVGTALIVFTPIRPSALCKAPEKAASFVWHSPFPGEAGLGLQKFILTLFDANCYYSLEVCRETSFVYLNFQKEASSLYMLYISGEQLNSIRQKLQVQINHSAGFTWKELMEALLKEQTSYQVPPSVTKGEKYYLRIKRIGKKTVIKHAARDFILVIEDTLTLNEPATVILLLPARKKNSSPTIKSFALRGNRLYATLTDPNKNNHFITAMPDSIKDMGYSMQNEVSWEWIVTPQMDGQGKLLLNVFIVQGKFKMLRIFPTEIVSVFITGKPMNFTREDYKWVIAGLLSIIGWVINLYVSRKKAQAANQQ